MSLDLPAATLTWHPIMIWVQARRIAWAGVEIAHHFVAGRKAAAIEQVASTNPMGRGRRKLWCRGGDGFHLGRTRQHPMNVAIDTVDLYVQPVGVPLEALAWHNLDDRNQVSQSQLRYRAACGRWTTTDRCVQYGDLVGDGAVCRGWVEYNVEHGMELNAIRRDPGLAVNVTRTGILAVRWVDVAVNRASKFARACAMAARKGLVAPTQPGEGISTIMVLPWGSLSTR